MKIVINHRATDEIIKDVKSVLSCFGSKLIDLSASEHDRITADTQAVTHAAFLSMGAAWAANQQFPWEIPRYVGGIENVKINITLRIYSNKWHVYAGLAMQNAHARAQLRQYARSVTELFKLMLAGARDQLAARVKAAGEAVFARERDLKHHLLLEDAVLDRFSLAEAPASPSPSSQRVKNNHLSLLAMVDCWWKLGIVPYDHMICSTPIFRILLGSAEYLFRNPALLDDAIATAIDDTTFRTDDLEFTFAARDWSQRVSSGHPDSYRAKFELVAAYFQPRFDEAKILGNQMISTILEKTRDISLDE